MLCQVVRAGQRQFQVESHELFVTLIDVRGVGGRQIAEWALGEESVAERLGRADRCEILPLAIPLRIGEGEAVVYELFPALSLPLASRPQRTIPVLIIDVADEAILTFLSPSTLLAEA
jgi:hypothetical protein